MDLSYVRLAEDVRDDLAGVQRVALPAKFKIFFTKQNILIFIPADDFFQTWQT